jgi:hypothetical protein
MDNLSLAYVMLALTLTVGGGLADADLIRFSFEGDGLY